MDAAVVLLKTKAHVGSVLYQHVDVGGSMKCFQLSVFYCKARENTEFI